ncbi:peptidoglycan DD-metalloendopeptidase family protein [Desulfurivibrio dismutans]|uniref:peptidoglycan DD-metalloendopeptidase family protein n=1 Tax=Desulfurivibrio dismutans TaxID=1398908 RepID=UPI0023DCBFE0|nr:peptidoglycan DD-metalloendopeptidase family protein [Desulfurivibrio alkaliphilus]MDF1613955.1 peptidoglycan DD-metalloendopeptidase family protein [Desulfurivibrio alkaliphilus]
MDLTGIYSVTAPKTGSSQSPTNRPNLNADSDFARIMEASRRPSSPSSDPKAAHKDAAHLPPKTVSGLSTPDQTTSGGEERPVTLTYTVSPGDTLSGIVAGKLQQKGVSHSRSELYRLVNTVAGDNNLTNPDRIFPGQRLNMAGLPRFGGGAASPVAHRTTAIEATPLGDTLQPPALGRISSEFGRRLHPIAGHEQHHDGLDIVLPQGTPIKPVAAGTVIAAGDNGNYGLTVDIDHGNGLSSRYAHLSRILVQPGQQITAGQTIARSGATGLANGPHLHLEIHQDRQPIDPLTMLTRPDLERGPLQADGTRPGDPDPHTGEYTVRPGDTLSTIAAREMHRQGKDSSPQDLHRQVLQLAAANNLRDPDRIVAGQRLNLSILLSA